jgi:hypothetical protein
VDVCRPIRERKKVRLDGMAKKGYCSSLKRWFIGLREHLVFTPDGRIAFMLQLEGNRHDVQGLYACFETAFRGCLPADNGYWPKQDKRLELEEHLDNRHRLYPRQPEIPSHARRCGVIEKASTTLGALHRSVRPAVQCNKNAMPEFQKLCRKKMDQGDGT